MSDGFPAARALEIQVREISVRGCTILENAIDPTRISRIRAASLVADTG